MKINKKIAITAVIVIIVAICGIIVYNTQTVPKMLVGGIYNGATLRNVTDHSDLYDEYDLHNASAIEKKIAENTSVLISSMTLTSDNSGTVTLRITSPDIKSALEGLAEYAVYSSEQELYNILSEGLLQMFKNNGVTKRAEPVYIESDMKFVNDKWIIIPNAELYDILTGNFGNIIGELYAAD